MPTPPSSRICDLKSIVEAGRRSGLLRGPNDPVMIEKNGTPLATSGAFRSQWMDITPQMAAHWLENNFRNRPVKEDVVIAYARDMSIGDWVSTHQGIAFNDRDELIDGQHRLLAIIRSGMTIRMMVTFGLPSIIRGREMTTMDAVDRGATRSVADQLTIQHGMKNAGIIASTSRSIAALCSTERTRRLSVGQTIDIYRAFEQAINWFVERRSSQHGLRQAGVIAGFALALQPHWTGKAWFGAGKVAAMFERLVEGEALKERSAVKCLHAFLTSEEAKLLTRGTDRALAELVLQAIFLEIGGKPVTKLELSTEGADYFRNLQPDRIQKISVLFQLAKSK